MPMLFTRGGPNHVTWTNFLDRAIPDLYYRIIQIYLLLYQLAYVS